MCLKGFKQFSRIEGTVNDGKPSTDSIFSVLSFTPAHNATNIG